MPNLVVGRPLRKSDLGDKLGPHPTFAPDLALRPTSGLCGTGTKWGFHDLQFGKSILQVGCFLGIPTGADLPTDTS